MLSPRLEGSEERKKRGEALRDLQQTAPGRADYAEAQKGGNPGTGLKRQLDRAREDAAGARRDADVTGLGTSQRTREAEAEVKRLEERQVRESGAARKRQGGEKYGPPMPEPRGERERTLSERIAEDGLGVRPPADEPLDSYGRLRDRRNAPAPPSSPPAPSSDERTVTSTAPPLTDEQRAAQERKQARSRLMYANPDAVPPGPPSPPLPSAAAAADAQRQREQQLEAGGHAGHKSPVTTVQQAKDLRRAVEERKRIEAEKLANKAEGSVAACGGGGGSLGPVGGGVDYCVVADSQGLGWSKTASGGPSLGPDDPKPGFHRSVSLRGSNANIDELNGPSTYGGASVFRGPGLEGGLSVTDDGQYVSDSLGIGVGVDASAGVKREYTEAHRWFDWPTLPSWEDLARYATEYPAGSGT
ncbi:hypothetical protein [Amycolatopsis magusensis]|uniref:Uncharacterized protein n=1 Tax=Amycolatopsis magusensis TaxID=882444 RepID=A0ABS4PJB8_9PSEU|nr:hypothetical protein [Amycolatopsis magusensis]MBP2179519.1 hypothetical protein [Amycolatopsis magusensis]